MNIETLTIIFFMMLYTLILASGIEQIKKELKGLREDIQSSNKTGEEK